MTAIKMNPQINPTSAMRLIQTLASEKTVQDWMEKNGDKVDDLFKWSDNYEWK